MSSYVFRNDLTSPQFDEPDAELQSWKLEQQHTNDPVRLAELDSLIRERLKELNRIGD